MKKDKLVIVRVEEELDNYIKEVLELYSRQDIPNNSVLIRKALYRGLAELKKDSQVILKINYAK